MKVLVLGGNGMLGHKFCACWCNLYDLGTTFRANKKTYQDQLILNSNTNFFNVDIQKTSNLQAVFDSFKPIAVVNAIGVTKQLTTVLGEEVSNKVNSIFPYELARLCEQYRCRLIHLSSDCIFSGKKGSYTEDDISDAEDLYGQSKAKGEVSAEHVLTLRKSTIGLEAGTNHGLIEWFLSQKGIIRGYSKAIYSGIIASELASVIEMILVDYPKLHGIYNVASAPISKYNLLVNLNECLQRKDLTILPDDEVVCDRSLDGARFEEITKYKAPSWDDMIEKLACEIRERESQ